MQILITGGSGFIGSHSVSAAHSMGISTQTIDLVDGSDYKEDISEIDWNDFHLTEFDAVIHLAALISVPESFSIPEKYNEVNVESTERIFSACADQGVKRVIFASSAAVYGSSANPTKIIGQEAPPESPYAQTKLAGEDLARKYATNKCKFSVFRFFNVYGTGQDADSPYASVIPKFVSLSCRNETIKIEGDGKQTRDFIHVSDVANTLISACSTIPECSYEIINLGTGKGTSVIDFASLLLQILKEECRPSESKIKHLPPRVGDIRESLADLTGLEKYADPETFLPFEKGIRDLVQEELKKPINGKN